jgi:hypothetical protein
MHKESCRNINKVAAVKIATPAGRAYTDPHFKRVGEDAGRARRYTSVLFDNPMYRKMIWVFVIKAKVKFALKQAMKTQTGNKGMVLLFP